MVQTPPGPGGGGAGPTGSQIVSEVKKFVGDPYVYGATGPNSFDCSGLVQYVFGQLGIKAPRTSEDQWAWVKRIPRSQLGPGDLVFAQFPGDNASPGHVGIYTGGGQVLSAEDPALGVGYATLSSWSGNIVGYGKAPDTTVTPGPGSGAGSGDSGVLPPAITAVLEGVWAALGGDAAAAPTSWSQLDPLSGAASALGSIAQEFEGMARVLTWLTLPSNWTRIFAGLFGTVFLGAGVWFIIREAG